MVFSVKRRALLAATALLALGVGPALSQDVNLRFGVFNDPTNVGIADGLKAAFEAANPGITLEIELYPQNDPNFMKTMLATGNAPDVGFYNSGSLFQALNPTKSLVDLSGEPWQADVLDSFKSVVTGTDGKLYGAPYGGAGGGGIIYNIPLYKELGLSVPKTWDEFMANNEKIKAAGKTAVIQSFGSTWTSQLFVLGDYFNVQAAVPNFAADYTANKAHFADTPAAMEGFQHGADVFNGGYLNDDFAAATFEEALTKVATGEGAHYPMLNFAFSTIKDLAPEHANDVGFFAIPGKSADSNGLTVWMPNAIIIPQTSVNIDAAKKFVAFAASVEGCDVINKAIGGIGPYLIKGCTLPSDIQQGIADMLPYFQQDGTTAPALEFVSPIKGPALENITVEVGSGIRTPADAAALYDEDVKKQAQQLGLPGWN